MSLDGARIAALGMAAGLLGGLLLGWLAHESVWRGELAQYARINAVVDWRGGGCRITRYEPVGGNLSLAGCHDACKRMNYPSVGWWSQEACVCYSERDCG